MSTFSESQIRSVLRELLSKSPDMEAASVISRDGLSTAAVLGEETDPEQLGAMCAALLGLADTTAAELHRGTLRMVLIDGTDGVLLLIHIGDSHVLAVAARPTINLGFVLREAKNSAEKLVGNI